MKRISQFWTPIFILDGNLLAFTSSGFSAESEDAAHALGATVGPGIEVLTGAEYTGEALRVSGSQSYVPAKLRGHSIAVLSGPVFQQIARNTAEQFIAA